MRKARTSRRKNNRIVAVVLLGLALLASSPPHAAVAGTMSMPDEMIVRLLVRIVTALGLLVLIIKAIDWAIGEVQRSLDELMERTRRKRRK